MRYSKCVVLALCGVVLYANAITAIEFHAPEWIERGAPLVSHLGASADAVGLRTALQRDNGEAVTAGEGYRTRTMRDVEVWVSLLGVPSTLPPGVYRLEAEIALAGGATVTKVRGIEVVPRAFALMRIALNQAMSDLRETTDPRRFEQARRMVELVARYNQDAIYNEGPFIVPVENARVSADFGDRRVYDYSDGVEAQSVHFGIDFAAPIGTPVAASGAGRVVFASERIITGKTVVIEHLPGVFGLYYHLDRIDAEEGALLRRGDRIGTVGMTGLATGPHLHWEFRVGGVPVDPRAFVDRPLVDKAAIFRRIKDNKTEATERG